MNRAVGMTFGDRFELVERASTGLLLDLDSGNFYRLNRTAALVCAALRDGRTRVECVDLVREVFAIDASVVARDVDSFARLLDEHPPRRDSQNPVRFETAYPISTMHWNGTPVVRIDIASGDLPLEWLANDACRPAEALLWAAPHVLTLLGVHVLHASSVGQHEGVIAFTGQSGAGKTTLAQTFEASGSRLVSEDLLVIDAAAPSANVFAHGEREIRRWVAHHAASFGTGREVRGADLAGVIRGESLPLRELLFLGARHTRGPRIERTALDDVDAIARILENSFAEVGTRDVFRRALKQAVSLAESVSLFDCSAPEGLDALSVALRQLQ